MITNEQERKKEYEFYGCYNYENNIIWRMIFIQTFIIVCFIYAIQDNLHPKQYVYIFIIIFLVTYFTTNWKIFHFYRVMASKVKESIPIM